MYKLLVVDDDAAINSLLIRLLGKKYDVRSAFSGTEAMLLLEKEEFDLLILDLMLPGMTGEQVLEKNMQGKRIPVIGLSAKDDVQSKIALLQNGADDYITKPFDNDELLVRIEVVLRRIYEGSGPAAKPLCCGELQLDPRARRVTLKGESVSLTKNEFAILQMLMEHPEQVFTKDMMYEVLWNEQLEGTENAINVHISNLRKKLAAVDDSRQYIKTVWGIGFKMDV